jgi:hypothetical protein
MPEHLLVPKLCCCLHLPAFLQLPAYPQLYVCLPESDCMPACICDTLAYMPMPVHRCLTSCLLSQPAFVSFSDWLSAFVYLSTNLLNVVHLPAFICRLLCMPKYEPTSSLTSMSCHKNNKKPQRLVKVITSSTDR